MPPTTLFICEAGAPPAAAWSHQGGQTRSWPDSRRYGSENLWVRRRLLWTAHLSNKYLMDLLISEKALLGEDVERLPQAVTSSGQREHKTKGHGAGEEAQRSISSILGARISFSFCSFTSWATNQRKKRKITASMSSGSCIPIPSTFHCKVHFVHPSLIKSDTLVVYKQFCSCLKLRWDCCDWQGQKILFLRNSIQLKLETLILCTKKKNVSLNGNHWAKPSSHSVDHFSNTLNKYQVG